MQQNSEGVRRQTRFFVGCWWRMVFSGGKNLQTPSFYLHDEELYGMAVTVPARLASATLPGWGLS